MDRTVKSTNRNSILNGAAAGAFMAALAVGGGYLATASAAPAGAVNAQPAAVQPGAPGSFADVVERVAPAVVSIDVEGKADPSQVSFFGIPDQGDDQDQAPGAAPGQALPKGFDFRRLIPQQPDGRALPKTQATGSGFFISADGYVVTNNHVVEGADKITVRTGDDRTLKATLVGRDPATDLAVIKVEGRNFPFVSFEERAKPRVGDWVVAVGNPFNLGGTATAGIVSALGRSNVSGSSYVDYMQIDAPINRGNSGGPTFDMYGRVVGVNTAIFSPTGGSVGIGFDIPADVASSVTRQLISGGKVTRGYIGATVQNVTPEIAESLGLPSHTGALVADLTPGGPSEQAGLRPGDLVLQVNGHEVASATDLTRQVALARGGDVIRMQVRRDGKVREIPVRSGIRPTEASLALGGGQGDGKEAAPEPKVAAVLGMKLIPNPQGGVTVQGVAGDSDAGQKGLKSGDVILRAGDHVIAAPADLSAAAAEARQAGRKSVLLLVTRSGRQTFVPVEVEEGKG